MGVYMFFICINATVYLDIINETIEYFRTLDK